MATDERVMLAHGGGGRAMRELIEREILPRFDNEALRPLSDAASIGRLDGRAMLTTDAFVVKPPFFPGGDIGRLAICGTVNDLAVSGAVPAALTLSLIVEEGFPLADLRRTLAGAGAAAAEAGLRIAAGDFKVVERGAADGIYASTAGVGVAPPGLELDARRIRPGDAVILTGTMGDHGVALLSVREGLAFETPVISDVAPLNALLSPLYDPALGVRCMRDPTRGGVAAALNEMAEAAGVTVVVEESAVPVTRAVRWACEMLGLDPFLSANEGKALVFCAPESADAVLAALRSHRLGRYAARIGTAVARREAPVIVRTAAGGERILDVPFGEELPRIC
ncbi:MAG: hydrogenase expression/formation protein HypE [Planctomycetota bacterium]|nr:hydrogenase expression/formation protein HypE [Planctomycetota bacterium]